jgi:hexosaminidase
MCSNFFSFLRGVALLACCLKVGGFLKAQSAEAERYPLIPYPVSVLSSPDEFVINRQTTLTTETGEGLFSNEQLLLQQILRKYLGANTIRLTNGPARNTIILKKDPSINDPEGYRLSVSSKQVVLSAGTPAGMFYAVETLRQLLPAVLENGHGERLLLPGVEIEDHPAFPWRGMQLDVSRHFFSTAYLKKYIDMMAMYKFNKLHLHLTDDQGWRLEIKKYPRLTSESAWRSFDDQDSACMALAKETGNPDFRIDPQHIRHRNGQVQYGGFYSQEEMKEVIRYAASRHIEIVPEIDMPGHMMAAIQLYPELTCEGTRGKDWREGFSTPICPCKDNTLQFAKDIFTEVADLFPSRYIHIGGDEVEKSHWKNSELCRQFMLEHHLDNVDQLQSYFNDYIQAFFRSRGKVLVGWDEIVEGGIDSSAVVMFWRPWAKNSPFKATANGNKVIMTPDGPLYFDAFPDRNSLNSVYHYNPTDTMYGLNEEQQKNIIGVQANLWSERVPTGERADYMVMPRMSALAELGWTHKDLYESYLQRLDRQYDRLDRLNIHYRLPDLPEVADRHVFIDTASFMIKAPLPGLTLRYTTDGSDPVRTSPVLSHPLMINHTLTVRVAAFTASGRRGDVSAFTFDRQAYAESLKNLQQLSPGLHCDLYRGNFNRTTAVKGVPDTTLILPGVVIPAGMPSSGFGLKFTGYIDVPETGIYNFFLTSDDGSQLHIANRLVVDNDGLHPAQEKSGQVALEKGIHNFSLDFIDGGGGYQLDLTYSKDQDTPRPVPFSWFKIQ